LGDLDCSDCQQDSSQCEVLLRKEAEFQEFTDEAGNWWRKVYFGGGSHLQNWVEQSNEIYGPANIFVEEVDYGEMPCFNQGEHAFRIWARKYD